MTNIEKNNSRKTLIGIISKKPESLQAFVAREALTYDDMHAFFETLLQKGCTSGIIPFLTKSGGINWTFQKYQSEIQEISKRLKLKPLNGNQPDFSFQKYQVYRSIGLIARKLAKSLKIPLEK